jgi:tRNA pseudouridine38-40 synthase
MRTLRMTLAYVGTAYAGWQIQPARATIQGLLERTLGNMLDEPVRLVGAGRTDAGVHALGQVASFATARTIPLYGLRRGLNARLPESLRVLAVDEVPETFNARSDARGKDYRYRLSTAEVLSPFEAPFVTPLQATLDAASMASAAERLLGRHDFTSFCRADSTIEDRRRTIVRLRVTAEGENITYDVSGDGFMRHMIRTIVGTLVEVGRGRLRPADIEAVLAARDRRRAGVCMPARGLTLMKVHYDGGAA